MTSNGNNLMRNVNCTVQGSGVTVTNDPLLGPLQNNGGPTETHALLAGSPAIDGGNPGGCQDQFGALRAIDQRGFPRPAVGCDIGEYELLTGSTSVVAALLPSSRSVLVNTPATAFATIINTGQAIAGIVVLHRLPACQLAFNIRPPILPRIRSPGVPTRLSTSQPVRRRDSSLL